jgi:hypothetical protein
MTQPTGSSWNSRRIVGSREHFAPSEAWNILQKLKAREDWHDAALLTVGIDSLLRCSDLLRLRVRDVVDQSGKVTETINFRQRKNKRNVAPALTKTARDELQKWIDISGKQPTDFLFTRRKSADSNPIDDGWSRDVIKGWAELIYLDPTPYSSHSLRRTKPHFMYRRGVDIAYISTLLGHKDTSTTLVYLGIKDEEAQYHALKHDIWNKAQHPKTSKYGQPRKHHSVRTQDFWVFEVGQAEIAQRLDQLSASNENLTNIINQLLAENQRLTSSVSRLLKSIEIPFSEED